jgi:APA family basic amino acid/polyamine antiporter
MIVTETVGVGIFLTPATLIRTLGTPGRVLAVWAVMAALTVAGSLCYAELATRYPKAGGGYVFLREAFGARCAFIYGWMALLVMDPGLAAALGIGFAQYLLATLGLSSTFVPAVAVAGIIFFGLLTLLGLDASTRLLRWTAAAKLACVGLLAIVGLLRSAGGLAGVGAGATPDGAGVASVAALSAPALAAAIMTAFFAFGGWWDLGKMSEEIAEPRRTLPRALVGGVALVALIYALVSLTFFLVAPADRGGSDELFVSRVGTALFGPAAGRLLAAMVTMAVSGSLAAVLLGAPRVYIAMARDGLFPARLARVDARRHASAGATLIQVSLACVLVLLGSFDQILGYFVPAAVFFLGLSAAGLFVLPRPAADAPVFRTPAYPWPLLLFLLLITAVVLLFAAGRPWQTALGAGIVALGIPVSWRIHGLDQDHSVR